LETNNIQPTVDIKDGRKHQGLYLRGAKDRKGVRKRENKMARKEGNDEEDISRMTAGAEKGHMEWLGLW